MISTSFIGRNGVFNVAQLLASLFGASQCLEGMSYTNPLKILLLEKEQLFLNNVHSFIVNETNWL